MGQIRQGACRLTLKSKIFGENNFQLSSNEWYLSGSNDFFPEKQGDKQKTDEVTAWQRCN